MENVILPDLEIRRSQIYPKCRPNREVSQGGSLGIAGPGAVDLGNWRMAEDSAPIVINNYNFWISDPPILT